MKEKLSEINSLTELSKQYLKFTPIASSREIRLKGQTQ